MPSSLIFAGLVVIWLLILVPAVVRHQQDVTRPTTSTRSGRVLERSQRRRKPEQDGEMDEVNGGPERTAPPRARHAHSRPATARASGCSTSSQPLAETVWEQPPPRYRPGRGGFDPQAAALAARQRYVFRQRVVCALLIAALVSAVIAAVGLTAVWWVHVVVDLVLVGYLTYLRRQVRLEEAIRARRAARMAARRARAQHTRSAAEPGVERPNREAARRPAQPDRYVDEISVPEMRRPEPDRRDERDDRGRPPRIETRQRQSEPDRREEADHRNAAQQDVEQEERALPRLTPIPPPPLPEGMSLVEAEDVEFELRELDAPDDHWGYRRAAG